MGQSVDIRGVTIAALVVVLALNTGAQVQQEGKFRTLLQQGFALHQQAKYTEAILLLKEARQLEPGDYFVNLLLGIDLLRTGRTAAAIGYLRTAAEVNPAEDTPEEYLGEAHASLGDFADAAAAYIEAVKRGKGSEQSLLTWAGFALERFRQIGEELRSSEAGVGALRKLQAEAAKPMDSLKCSGTVPLLEKRLAGRHAVSGAGIEVRHDLSLCYAMEADRAAARLKDNAEDPAALHQLRGDVLLRLSNDAAGAISEYEQAISLRRNDPSLHERLAEAQMAAGQPEAARQSAMKALEIDPHRTAAMGTLVTLAMSNRNYEQALPWLEKMKNESPRNRQIQVDLGKALAETGKPSEALANLKEALSAGYPDEKGALHSLEARLLRELGRNAEAAKAAEDAKRLSDTFQNRTRIGTAGNVHVDH